MWLDVCGYEGLYEVSDQGQVRSKDRTVVTRSGPRRYSGRLLTNCLDQGGHYRVTLSQQGKLKSIEVHLLMMRAFKGLPKDDQEIRHLNGNKKDNRLSNLAYGTKSENQLDCRLTGHDKYRRVIREDGKIFDSIVQAAEFTDCGPQHITDVCRGQRKTCGGFSWNYV